MKEKNKKLIILVSILLLFGGISFAYFVSQVLSSGKGSSVEGTTATIKGSTLNVVGTLEFNDTNIYPGHSNVSSIKVTATGDNELIPYNLIWSGTNTLSILNYTVYKTSSNIEVTSTCEKKTTVENGSQILKEECTISNIEQLGSPISSGTINKNDTKITLAKDELVTATNDGDSKHYYIILEYPNLEENQNIDIGGNFTGKITVEASAATADITISKMYKQTEDSYEEITSIPTEGYTLNAEKSICTNNATPIYDKDANKVIIANLTTRGAKCDIYFDKQVLAKDVILANKNITSRGSITRINSANTTGTVYTAADDDGTSYYFSGNPTDNWVKFAGFYWRIIRINGDGTIRLIYNGTSATTTGTGTQISASAYNTNFTDNTFVGYMYGSTGQNTYEATHTNTTNSTIKGMLDNWYTTNISEKGFGGYIDNNAGFCNDRKIASSTETYWTNDTKRGYKTNTTAYAPFSRFLTTGGSWNTTQQTPTYKCSQTSDLFTPTSSNKGNKKLINPVGLITADEVVYGGGFGGTNNTSYYLYTNQYYWTMSPYYYFSTNGYASVFRVSYTGNLGTYGVNETNGVRPVINLKSDTVFQEGSLGTSNSPYIVEGAE